MKSLKNLLDKHNIPGSELSNIRHQCASIASYFVHIDIKPEQIDYNDGVVSFSIPPLLKTEILIHQKEFIAQLKSLGTNVSTVR